MLDYGLGRAVASSLRPRAQMTWDQTERIVANQRIWKNRESIVHRFPEHYKERFWRNVIATRRPVHYEPPTKRYEENWNKMRKYPIETEHHPILPIYPPEAERGLWGGEGVVKSYYLSKPFVRKKILPRRWVPRMWFPELQHQVLYSEILNRYMKITVTPRALNLIDEHHGLDGYILATPEYDLHSKLGCKLKRLMLVALAKEEQGEGLKEKTRQQIADRYAEHRLPLEEAEWVGLDLNEAAIKLQDLEEATPKTPLKFKFADGSLALSPVEEVKAIVEEGVVNRVKAYLNE